MAYQSNYDKHPFVDFNQSGDIAWRGWQAITEQINLAATKLTSKNRCVALECYPGLLEEEVLSNLQNGLKGKIISTSACFYEEEQIRELIYPDVTDDEVFGYITRLTINDFLDPVKVKKLQQEIAASNSGPVFVYGPGASVIAGSPDLLVYFDMPRWEGQLRFRRNAVNNLGVTNKTTKASLQYKQAFFVDWRVADKLKKTLMARWDLVIDTTVADDPKMVTGDALREALAKTINRPFRVVPFFDPGPWGGQWMKEYCDLDRAAANYAWCFDCVPEENSLLIKFNDFLFETPSINLVFAHSRALLGSPVQARFGDEFPIRFDFLDTMQGGNLSLQVHPYKEYIREKFGMDYTQDESYYMLEAGKDAVVYLGLKDDVNTEAMFSDLEAAQSGGTAFDADKYVAKWPVKKHDHVLIPAGTIHCSGSDSMVLEISATPYIFTFKLWDWGRMGLDGKPRPINIAHGKKVIDKTRTPDNTKKELINAVTQIASGDGWTEERTGLHEREFIETRRHWFSKIVTHHTNGSVNVLNLIEGREAIVESPDGSFAPFIVHYAETFIIPEAVRSYTIRPHGESEGKQIATIKAFVRHNA
ncbi:MAG: class I mannose-6-phosphate isomerase [Chitinophagaceae bacterium]